MRTKVSKQRIDRNGLRTTIPWHVCGYLDLKEGDSLDWNEDWNNSKERIVIVKRIPAGDKK